MSGNNPNNPYSQAAGAYGKSAAHAIVDQRGLEGQILLKAAQRLQLLRERLEKKESVSREEIDDTLTYNRKLWTVFASETGNPENPLPREIKANIASLSVFIFKRTMEILADPVPEKISALIDINRQIASGLLKSQPQKPADPTSPLARTDTKTDHSA